MEFECITCKTKTELNCEQLKKLYEYTDGTPTVAELCETISRLKRKTCGQDEKKMFHIFSITNVERDVMDPIVNEYKGTANKFKLEIEPQYGKTVERIAIVEKELSELKEKEAQLSGQKIEMKAKVEELEMSFENTYGHKEILLWS